MKGFTIWLKFNYSLFLLREKFGVFTVVDSTKRKYSRNVIKLDYLFELMRTFQNYSLITKIATIAVSLAFSLANLESAQALIFVENLSEPSLGGTGVNSSIVLGSSFTTDNNNYSLNFVTLPLEEIDESPFSINLHTDNGGDPGTVIGNLNTTEDILPGSLNNYSFTPTGSVNLSFNTIYWLTSSVVTPGRYGWGLTNSLNQTSPGAWTVGDEVAVSGDAGVSWDPPGLGFAMQFNVDADNAI